MEFFAIGASVAMGENALDRLKELPVKKAMLFCDPFLVKSGASRQITNRLDQMGAAWELFDGIIPDPTIDVVSAGVARIMAFGPDTVIAMGGGSAIDTSKAVSYIYTRSAGVEKPLLVAVPTTSGTGSEVTSFSVISDPAAGVKYPLVSDELLPDVAILDPSLTLSVPAVVTADTGLDVLTHAVEAYVSPRATDMTDALAEKAAAAVFEYLECAVKNGGDMAARKHLQNASCMAAMAFNNAGLGLCHAMAHSMGAVVHMSHGRCNAMLLPHVVRFNSQDETVRKRYAKLAAKLGCCCHSDAVAVEGLIRRIEELMRAVNIPGVIADAEKRKLCAEKAAEMACNAQKDRCMADNPISAQNSQIEELYQKIAR